MGRDYKISKDGIIFEIKEDGSISKIARIDDNGNVSSIFGTTDRQEKVGKGKYWLIIILLFVTSAVLGILYLHTSDSLSYYRWEYYQTDKKLSEVNVELSEKESTISKIAVTYPLIITDISIGNAYKNGDIQTN